MCTLPLKLISLLPVLCPLIAGAQAFTPRRPFVMASTSITPGPPLLPGMYFWAMADNNGTNIMDGVSGGFPANGASIWRWYNYGTQTNVFGQRCSDALYASCNIPTPVGIKWLETKGPNGKPTLSQSGGTAPIYTGACGVGPLVTNPVTTFCVIQITNTALNQYLWQLDAPPQDDVQILFDYASAYGTRNLRIGKNGAAVIAGPLPDSLTNWTVLTICCDGANSYVRTNGVLMSTFTCYSFAPRGQLSLFAYASTGAPFVSYMSEFLLYDITTLSTNDMQQVELYLKTKWGL